VELSTQVFAKAGNTQLPTYWAVDSAFAKTCISKIEALKLDNVVVLPLQEDARVPSLLGLLLALKVGRLLVEGGPTTLSHFVEAKAYDEVRQWSSQTEVGNQPAPIKACVLPMDKVNTYQVGKDVLRIGRIPLSHSNC